MENESYEDDSGAYINQVIAFNEDDGFSFRAKSDNFNTFDEEGNLIVQKNTFTHQRKCYAGFQEE